MRIAINLLFASGGDFGGARYIRNLARGLAKIDFENKYTLYVSARDVPTYSELGPNFTLVPTVSYRPLRILWEQTALPFDLKRRHIDVYHGAAFVTPLIKTCRQVLTINDMTYYLVPGKHTSTKVRYFRALMPGSVARSERVIALSESVKADIIRILGTPPHKIEVIYLGKGEKFRPIPEQDILDRIRKKYGLNRKTILFVGLIEPGKNLPTLIRAYATLKGLHQEYDLVLAGKMGSGYPDALQCATDCGVRDHVLFPGFIPDDELPELYNLAEVYVHTTLYEGFGLPVLEAMSCGTPVITSNRSSLPEIAGGAALLVDPGNVEEMAAAMHRVLTDAGLRKQMSQKGLEQSKLFTWEKTAQATLKIYQTLGTPDRK